MARAMDQRSFGRQHRRLAGRKMPRIARPHRKLAQMHHVTMTSTGTTRLAGVLGWPVAHSLSPRLHSYWLTKYGIDGAYLPLPVEPANLPIALRGLAAAGFAGANVTIPHKQAVLALCDELAPSAQQAGAVNTLCFDGPNHILGANTDGAGFLASLTQHAIDPAAGPALILGAGGAARAIAAALLGAGCATTITSRTLASAQTLAAALPGLAVLPWPATDLLAAFRLLINATAGGMAGHAPLAFDLSRAAPGLVVADIVYAPRETRLLAAARAAGLVTVEGIDMLLHQAAAGFEAWFGILPAIDAALRDHVLAR
jgi:shikimate dehydrogenase